VKSKNKQQMPLRTTGRLNGHRSTMVQKDCRGLQIGEPSVVCTWKRKKNSNKQLAVNSRSAKDVMKIPMCWNEAGFLVFCAAQR
jgi:hypothetical protein